MYRRFHERFGTAGLVVAVIALIAALAGTAIAASGGLTPKQKKQVIKIAKKYAGKPGAPGATGPAGTNGTNGTNGKDGAPGAPGANGKSVVVANEEPEHCENEEGVTYKIEGSTESEVCNGKEGSPWTAGGTLPHNATETGSWSVSGKESAVDAFSPISFPIPLAAPLDSSHVVKIEGGFGGEGHLTNGSTTITSVTISGGSCAVGQEIYDRDNVSYIPAGTTIIACGSGTLTISAAATHNGEEQHLFAEPLAAAGSGCTGGTPQHPKADPGFLCVYTTYSQYSEYGVKVERITPSGAPTIETENAGASTSGAVVDVTGGVVYRNLLYGTWAVTAP